MSSAATALKDLFVFFTYFWNISRLMVSSHHRCSFFFYLFSLCSNKSAQFWIDVISSGLEAASWFCKCSSSVLIFHTDQRV